MANNYFNFKQFTILQAGSVFKVGTDGVILGACADASGKKRILDIGTGTGLIALMIAQRYDTLITAIEPDMGSFELANLNVSRSNWSGKINVLNISLQNFDNGGFQFDLIITNPPYFKGSLKNPDRRKAAFRHDISLNYDDLLSGVDRHLSGDGIFQVILPADEGKILTGMARRHKLYCNNILKIRPSQESAVKRIILTFSKSQADTVESSLIIGTGRRHEFTEEYKRLTGDFYL